MPRWTVALALLLFSSPAAAGKGHPKISPDAAAGGCEACHAQRTPEVVKAWEGGAHGLMLVKCFVCHGSTGKDFARSAPASRCEGCHPEEVATSLAVKAAASEKRGRGEKLAACFSCHDPHSLAAAPGAANPHGAR